MRTLYLLCGMAFSGKSTLARAISASRPITLISLDDINHERGLWGGDGIPLEEWENTNLIAQERFAQVAKSGTDVLVDDTNSLRWLRDRWRDRAQTHGYATRVVFVDVQVQELLRRRAENAKSQ